MARWFYCIIQEFIGAKIFVGNTKHHGDAYPDSHAQQTSNRNVKTFHPRNPFIYCGLIKKFTLAKPKVLFPNSVTFTEFYNIEISSKAGRFILYMQAEDITFPHLSIFLLCF